MMRCRCFDLFCRGYRTRLHDGPKQTRPCLSDHRDSLRQLRGALQFHDRQMLATGYVADRKVQSNTASASNGRPRGSTWRSARPASSRLEPWRKASGLQAAVDLVRCSTIEGLVWPVVVVPNDEQRQLSSKAIAQVGDQQSPRALTLDCSNQPLHNSDAAVLSYRTEARKPCRGTACPDR